MAATARLAAVAKIIMGQSPPGDTYNATGDGLPLLNGPTEFGATSPECTLFTTDSRRECEPGDLIFCVRGSTTGRMNWADRKYSLGRGVCSFRGASPLETRFIRHCIQDQLHALLQLAGGGTFPNLSKDDIEQFEIPWPDNRIRIAAILSAYDDLIENNQRRIKILEEMARSLYREWFVHFRFPGHEQIKMVPSSLGPIPQGWEVKRLLDVATVTYGFPFESKMFNTSGIGTRIVRIRDIPTGSTETWTEENAAEKHHIKNGDILVGMDGDFHMCIWSGGPAYQNQRVAKFASQGEIGNYHLFLALEEPIQKFNKAIIGTTVAHLGDAHIKTIQIVWPHTKLLDQAQTFFEPMSGQILNLKSRTQNLCRTRDLLLPRLLSG